MEQNAGEGSEVNSGNLAEPMQFLSQSNWSPFIAPYRSVLTNRNGGTFRVSFGAANRNIQANESGYAVARVGPRNTDLRHREFAADDFTGNEHQRSSAFRYSHG